jgi:antitoxin component of MazEF toxin-antitoxin module
MTKEDIFPAKVRESGGSKVITIPKVVAEKYEAGEAVKVVISKN